MSLQEAGSAPTKTFMARMKLEARLPAQVMDADMQVPIRKFTEVLAEVGPNQGEVTILWPYGEATAQAVVPRSFVYIPPGQ